MKMPKRAIGGVAAFALAFSLCVSPSAAWATVEGDQTPLSEEEIAAAIAAGEVKTFDDQNAAQPMAASARSSSFFQCFSGDTRLEVAVMEAKAAYSQSDRAIIAGSNGWADALSAAGLAGVLDCPIMLTDYGQFTDCTRQALVDLGVSSVTIVGGPETVSTAVEQQIESMGIAVERIGGKDRHDVQMNIYQKAEGSWTGSTAIIASGTNFPDALSISPVSFKQHMPIFLVNGEGSLNETQKDALAKAVSEGVFSKVVIAGGPNSVSSATEAYAASLKGASGNAITVERLNGADRYEASASIARWSVEEGGLSWNNMAIATGEKPYDALCGSVLQGKTGSVLMVVNSSSQNGHAYDQISANSSSISSMRVFGGKASVTMPVRMDIADIFGIPYYEIPELKVYVDAGHGQNDSGGGYYDPGACANGYQEATLTAELANKVADSLRNTYGVETYVNDDGGWYKLRAAEAQALGCDLILSIHFNAGGGSGSMSIVHSYNAEPFSFTFQNMVHPRLIEGTSLRDLGKQQMELAILGGGVPAVMCEVAFIDNWSDMSTYQSRKDTVAQKIAAGIVGE